MAAPAGKAQLRMMEGQPEGSEQHSCHGCPHPKFLHSLLTAEGPQGVGIWSPHLSLGAPC